MAFQVGDKVVYPNHGIGVVEDILADALAGSEDRQFYKLRILSNATVVKVPIQNVDGVGLRRVITEKDVERIFDLLENRKIEHHSNWKGQVQGQLRQDAKRVDLRRRRRPQRPFLPQ